MVHATASVAQTPSVLPTPIVTLNPNATPYVPPPVNALVPTCTLAQGQRSSYIRILRTCRSCRGEAHIKAWYNWIGQVSSEPNKTQQALMACGTDIILISIFSIKCANDP